MTVGTLIGFAAIMSLLALRNIKAGVSPFALTQRGALEFIAGNHPELDVYGWDITPSVYEIEKKCDQSLFKSIPAVLKLYSDNPEDLVIRQFKKVWVLLNWFESHEINYFIENHYLDIYKFPWIKWPMLLGFSLLGMFSARKNRRRYFELYSYVFLYSLATVAFYVNLRFRVPLVPALAVFGGAGAEKVYGLLRQKKWKSLILASVFVIAIAVLLWPRPDDPLTPNDYHNLVRYHLIKEEPQKAREWYYKGLAKARQRVQKKGDPRSHYLMARMLFLGGAPLESVERELRNADKIKHDLPMDVRIDEFRKIIRQRQKGKDLTWKGYRL